MAGELLRPKYMVTKIVEPGIPLPPSMRATNPDDINSPFVIMPHKDPVGYVALLRYAELCEPNLASEILIWARKIASAPPEYGTQGTRNSINIRIKMLEMNS